MNRILFFMAIGMVLSLTLLPAKPAIAATPPTTNHCTSAQLPMTTTLQAVASSNLPVGEVIPGSDAITTVVINCTDRWNADGRNSCNGGRGWSLNPVSGALPVETAISNTYTYAGMPSGVGYQFLDASGQPSATDSAGRHPTDVPIGAGEQSIPLHFRLVKTDDTYASGSHEINMQLSCNGNEWANQSGTGSAITITVNSTLITETCSLIDSDIQIPLPSVVRSDFRGGVGSVAGTSNPINLDFQCGAYVNARFNISDNTELNNESDILKANTESTARNVGVRLLQDGSPVRLAPGKMFDVGTEFALKNPESSQKTISLPFSAEYVQTGVPVTPGSVKAVAVVTIAYE